MVLSQSLYYVFFSASLELVRATAIAEGITVVTEKTTQELAPARTKNCPTYIPGIGWTGLQDWNNAIARVQAGGHIEGWGGSGTFLSESHDRMLISAAGLDVYGGVERDDCDHKYLHIHYWAKNSRHNSIRLSE